MPNAKSERQLQSRRHERLIENVADVSRSRPESKIPKKASRPGSKS